MSDVLIRPARADDRAGATAIAFDGMREFGITPDPVGLDREVAAFGDGAASKLAEVAAELDGRLAGCVIAVRAGAERAKIVGLYVAPFARGLGLGRRLLESAVEACRRSGVRRVELHTWGSMTAAVRLYEAAGWIRGPDPDPAAGADRAYWLDLSARRP